MRASATTPMLYIDPAEGQPAVVAASARRSEYHDNRTTVTLLDSPAGISEAILLGTPESLRALAEAITGALDLLEVAPEGSVDYVARIGEPRRD